MIKKLTFILLALALFTSAQSFAQVKAPITYKLLPPPPEDPGGGGGGGGGGSGPINGGIKFFPNDTQYNTGAGFWTVYSNNGSVHSFGQASSSGSFDHGSSVDYKCKDHPNENDEARSAEFQGELTGRTFEFYDSPDANKNDDWTSVYFKKNPPTQYHYQVYTFEGSYEDEYVSVRYYAYNGLDGKVSRIISYMAN